MDISAHVTNINLKIKENREIMDISMCCDHILSDLQVIAWLTTYSHTLLVDST